MPFGFTALDTFFTGVSPGHKGNVPLTPERGQYMQSTNSYVLAGHFFELCDCSTVCPCWLGEEPDNGSCTGVFAWSVTDGNVTGIDVAGRKVVSASYHTGHRSEGGQEVFLFVDEDASESQANALADAFTGRLGGPLAELAGMLGVLKGTARAPIRLSTEDRTTTLTVGNSVAGAAEVLLGADGQATELAHSPVSRVLTARAEVAKTTGFRIGLGVKDFDLNVTGTAAMRGRFRYQNEGGDSDVDDRGH